MGSTSQGLLCCLNQASLKVWNYQYVRPVNKIFHFTSALLGCFKWPDGRICYLYLIHIGSWICRVCFLFTVWILCILLHRNMGYRTPSPRLSSSDLIHWLMVEGGKRWSWYLKGLVYCPKQYCRRVSPSPLVTRSLLILLFLLKAISPSHFCRASWIWISLYPFQQKIIQSKALEKLMFTSVKENVPALNSYDLIDKYIYISCPHHSIHLSIFKFIYFEIGFEKSI